MYLGIPSNSSYHLTIFHSHLLQPQSWHWVNRGSNCCIQRVLLPPPSPDEGKPSTTPGRHLVACSADGAYIVIAQKGGNVITVLDPLGTLVQSIPASVEILAIGIVDNTIFVASGDKLITWKIGAGDGETVNGSYVITAISVHTHYADRLVSSNDCSLVAFISLGSVVLYDTKAQQDPNVHDIEGYAPYIQFSQDGHWLYISSCCADSPSAPVYDLTKFEIQDGCLVGVSSEHLEDRESWDRFFPPSHRYKFTRSNWVGDATGHKHLWLPLNWRTQDEFNVQEFNVILADRFMAFIGRKHQKPIIIELQPQSHLLPIPYGEHMDSLLPSPSSSFDSP